MAETKKDKLDNIILVVTEIKTALVGFDGTTGALDEVKKNTKWRLKISGALILLSLLATGGWAVTLLKLFNKI